MNKNPHAVILGRKGGKAKSSAKALSSAANGKKGGRPKRPWTLADAIKESKEQGWSKVPDEIHEEVIRWLSSY